MWSPSPKTEYWILKPILFVACLIPSIALTYGLLQSSLGFNPVEVLTHETGEWGLRFLLASLLITPLRSLTKLVWLTRFRRMLGLFAFYYATLHFCIYFLWDQSLNLSLVIEDVLERPYVTIGFAAFCLLIPLAITSTNKIRRIMGRRWNTLHKMVYPLAGLVILHFFWLTKADYREPIIYACIFLALMLARVKINSLNTAKA